MFINRQLHSTAFAGGCLMFHLSLPLTSVMSLLFCVYLMKFLHLGKRLWTAGPVFSVALKCLFQNRVNHWGVPSALGTGVSSCRCYSSLPDLGTCSRAWLFAAPFSLLREGQRSSGVSPWLLAPGSSLRLAAPLGYPDTGARDSRIHSCSKKYVTSVIR